MFFWFMGCSLPKVLMLRTIALTNTYFSVWVDMTETWNTIIYRLADKVSRAKHLDHLKTWLRLGQTIQLQSQPILFSVTLKSWTCASGNFKHAGNLRLQMDNFEVKRRLIVSDYFDRPITRAFTSFPIQNWKDATNFRLEETHKS